MIKSPTILFSFEFNFTNTVTYTKFDVVVVVVFEEDERGEIYRERYMWIFRLLSYNSVLY